MGIPYSKQINAAFDQVTPLVASAYEVLETTKNIALFITGIQIAMIGLLALILLALIGLLFTLNPDLDKERKQIVTPAMKWVAGWIMMEPFKKYGLLGTFVGLVATIVFGYLIYTYHIRNTAQDLAEDFVEKDEGLQEKKESEKAGGEGENEKDEKSGKSK